MSEEDSFDLHIQDTLVAGAGLCNEEAVRVVVTEGPARIAELMKLGMHFDERELENGGRELDLGREGGHSKRRVLHFQDHTGFEIERTLVAQVSGHSSITVLENHMAVDFLTTGKLAARHAGLLVGVYVLDEETGEVETLRSDINVLATGGCGKVYLYTTNPDIAEPATEWRWPGGRARSRTWSSSSFIRPAFTIPRRNRFSISEAVRGEGGILLEREATRFMEQLSSGRMELAPRDIVARAIDAEMKRSGSKCVFLDITHKPAQFIKSRFPSIYQTCLRYGIDITRSRFRRAGGALSVRRGEDRSEWRDQPARALRDRRGGLHGPSWRQSPGEQFASGGLVLAHRALEKSTRNRKPRVDFDLPEWRPGQVQDFDELVVIYHNWDEIRRLMWDYVGIVRTDKRLQRAATRLRNLHTEIQEFYWNFNVSTELLELRNFVTVASLIVDCAISRRESRGLHYTLTISEADPVLSAIPRCAGSEPVMLFSCGCAFERR